MKTAKEFIADVNCRPFPVSDREYLIHERDSEWRSFVAGLELDGAAADAALKEATRTNEDLRRLVEEAQAERDGAVTDNFRLMAERDRLKGELAEARAQGRDEALREAADTVHAGALAADKEAGGALASLCLSLAEHAIRRLRKP